jgi:hypothetical protein
VIAFAILATLLGGNDDGDELKQMNQAQLLTLSMVLAVKSETETFIPLPGMGLNEISRKINSPFAALRQVTNIIRLMQNLAYLTYNSDNAYYQHDTRMHDAGDVKAVSDLLRLSGLLGFKLDPLSRLRQVQQAQTLR